MNASEFSEFRKALMNLLGGFPDWLSRGRKEEDQRTLLATWASLLGDVTLDDAKDGLHAIIKGDIDKPAYGDLPATIRRFARQNAAKRSRGGGSRRTIDGHELLDCPLCEDTGFVTCYHPKSIREYVTKRTDAFKVVPIRGGGERRIMPMLMTCAVPCQCNMGSTKQQPNGSVYDETRWIRKTVIPIEEQIAELITGTDERLQASLESRPNYSPSLAEWNR